MKLALKKYVKYTFSRMKNKEAPTGINGQPTYTRILKIYQEKINKKHKELLRIINCYLCVLF